MSLSLLTGPSTTGPFTAGHIMKVALYGAVLCKVAEKAAKLGLNPLTVLNKITPDFVKKFLTQGPLHKLLAETFLRGFQVLGTPQLSSTIVAPIVEEAIFRLGMQQGLKHLLVAAGCDPQIAKIASVFVCSVVFAMTHNASLNTTPGLELTLKGAAFGVSYEKGGYLAAVLAHAINNFRQNYTRI